VAGQIAQRIPCVATALISGPDRADGTWSTSAPDWPLPAGAFRACIAVVDVREVRSPRGHTRQRVTHSSFAEREAEDSGAIWRVIEFGDNPTGFASLQPVGANDGDGAVSVPGVR
jgi:hypothetical protein